MRRFVRIAGFGLLAAGAAWAGDAEQPYRISTEVKGVPDSRLEVVTSEAHYPYPPEKVWAVLTDFALFPQFLPRVKECQSLGVARGTEQIYFTFSLPFPLPNLWNIVALARDSANHRFEWDLVAGNMNANRGKFSVEAEPAGSVARMDVQVDVGLFLPKWVIKIGTKIFLPKVLRAFGDRVAELQRAQPKGTILPASVSAGPVPIPSR
ncbi:MAG: SRPBCC family protein [Pseudomonadota bacterium]